MIPLEMAGRIFGMFPSSLIIANSTETSVEPLVFIDAKKDGVYPTGATTMVVACLAVRQWPRQGLLRYTPDEGRRQ